MLYCTSGDRGGVFGADWMAAHAWRCEGSRCTYTHTHAHRNIAFAAVAMQLLLPSEPSRASVVMPLPPPVAVDQSDSDECSAASNSSDSSSDASSNAIDSSDTLQHQQSRRAYAVSSASSSSISSALGFSSTSDDSSSSSDDDEWWYSDVQFVDVDGTAAPRASHRQRRRHRRKAAATTTSRSRSTRARRELTMQAIWNAETLGFVALLIPLTGIATMVMTEALACTHHFDCTRNYPTLSYAATFAPADTAFTVGMCLTALFIFAASALFFWFLRLRLGLDSARGRADVSAQATAVTCLVAGVATAVTLAGLALFDMRRHHDAHIAFTVTFFIASWLLIVSCHVARRVVLLRSAVKCDDDVDSSSAGLLVLLPFSANTGTNTAAAVRTPSAWTALRHWRRLSIPMAFALGRLFIVAGITSTVLFGLLFLCVNGSWPNPLGFTAVQEAFFEAFAIVCQLLFMGTLSCELALLSHEVETHDYMELERRE